AKTEGLVSRALFPFARRSRVGHCESYKSFNFYQLAVSKQLRFNIDISFSVITGVLKNAHVINVARVMRRWLFDPPSRFNFVKHGLKNFAFIHEHCVSLSVFSRGMSKRRDYENDAECTSGCYSPNVSGRSNAAIAAMGLPVQLCKKLKIVFAIAAFSNFKPP